MRYRVSAEESRRTGVIDKSQRALNYQVDPINDGKLRTGVAASRQEMQLVRLIIDASSDNPTGGHATGIGSLSIKARETLTF